MTNFLTTVLSILIILALLELPDYSYNVEGLKPIVEKIWCGQCNNPLPKVNAI